MDSATVMQFVSNGITFALGWLGAQRKYRADTDSVIIANVKANMENFYQINIPELKIEVSLMREENGRLRQQLSALENR